MSDQEIVDLTKRIAAREGMHVADWIRMHETNQRLATEKLTPAKPDGFAKPVRTRVVFRVIKRAILDNVTSLDFEWSSDCITAPEPGDVVVRRSEGERTWYAVLHRAHDVDSDTLVCTVERTSPPP